MEFKEQLPVWKAEGVAPPETKQNEGWQIGDKPPADWFNYMWSRTYYSLDEIREKMNWLSDNSGKVETVNNIKPDSNKNIKLTGTNIAYQDGVTENIATKISNMDKEIDTVKQSGVEINKRISDKLNSMKIEASDTDSISENVTKIEDIPSHGELTKTITTQGGKQIITSGYYEGGEVKAQFNNLVPENIKSGVNVGGVLGNHVGYELINKVSVRGVGGTGSTRVTNIGNYDETYSRYEFNYGIRGTIDGNDVNGNLIQIQFRNNGVLKSGIKLVANPDDILYLERFGDGIWDVEIEWDWNKVFVRFNAPLKSLDDDTITYSRRVYMVTPIDWW